MPPEKLFAGLLVVNAVLLAMPAMAEIELLKLQNNPFARPPIPEKKAPPSKPVVVEQPEPADFELTATMVTESGSMVIVEGELIAVGETYRGMKLIEVKEGSAVFSTAGRKQTYQIETEVE